MSEAVRPRIMCREVVGLELMVGTDVLTVRDAHKPHAHQLRRISMTGSSSSHRDDYH